MNELITTTSFSSLFKCLGAVNLGILFSRSDVTFSDLPLQNGFEGLKFIGNS